MPAERTLDDAYAARLREAFNWLFADVFAEESGVENRPLGHGGLEGLHAAAFDVWDEALVNIWTKPYRPEDVVESARAGFGLGVLMGWRAAVAEEALSDAR